MVSKNEILNKHTLASITQLAFSKIPTVGESLSTVLFELNSERKKIRVVDFIESLGHRLKDYSLRDPSIILTEEFGDFLEGVILRVMRTSSAEKHHRFRDILLNNIEKPINQPVYDTYLDLVFNLTEIEILILKQHQEFNAEYLDVKARHKELQRTISKKEDIIKTHLNQARSFEFDDISKELQKLENERLKLEINIKSKEAYRIAEFYSISDDEFLYCKQSLASKALLIDSGVGSIGTRPFQIMSITQFGKSFIKFILAD